MYAFDLPPVPASNAGDTSYDVTKDVEDFGIGDFHIEMDVRGKGFDISTKGLLDYGMLLVRSGEINSPYSGPTVYIYDNRSVVVCIRKDEELRIPWTLTNPTSKITRHLVFSRTGSTLVAVIDGEYHQRTITKEISDVETLREAHLRF